MSASPDLTLPAAAADLLPHRPPMLLIERLVEYSPDAATAEACLPADSIFAGEGGRLEPVVMVELMAQAYAALRGYDDRLHGRPVKEGMLVAVRQARALAPAFAGERLAVGVRTTGYFEGFALMEGEVRRGGELVATGTLKLWIRVAGGEGAAR